MVLEMLKSLRRDMRQKGLETTEFDFSYLGRDYTVSVEFIKPHERETPGEGARYGLVCLIFRRKDDPDNWFYCYANSKTITADYRPFRTYFGAPYQPDGRAWVESFCEELAKYVPSKVIEQ